MISASKSTLSLNNLNILRPKVTKNLTNLPKKFCESPPRSLSRTRATKETININFFLQNTSGKEDAIEIHKFDSDAAPYCCIIHRS